VPQLLKLVLEVDPEGWTKLIKTFARKSKPTLAGARYVTHLPLCPPLTSAFHPARSYVLENMQADLGSSGHAPPPLEIVISAEDEDWMQNKYASLAPPPPLPFPPS